MCPVTLSHCPACASGKHGIHLVPIQVHLPSAPYAGGNAMKQGVGQLFLHRLKIFDRESRAQRPDSTGNVEAHTAGRHNTSEVGIERGDPADGKPIAPMGIGHRIGGSDDPRERCDVRDLFIDLLVHVANQRFAGIDHRRHQHLAVRRYVPFVWPSLLQQVEIHHCLIS